MASCEALWLGRFNHCFVAHAENANETAARLVSTRHRYSQCLQEKAPRSEQSLFQATSISC